MKRPTGFKVSTSHIMTDKQLEYLFVTAFEGGSNYWYHELRSIETSSIKEDKSEAFYDNIMMHGFKLVDTYTGKTHEIVPTEYWLALQRMADNQHKHFRDIVNDNVDAETGDVFLQTLVFGKVIYG